MMTKPITYQLFPGTLIGRRYRIERILGEGGYGITYYATDLRLDLPVAVKEFFPGFWVSRYTERGTWVHCRPEAGADFEAGLEKFHKEAQVLSSLHRIPEIVLVRDYLEENGTAYLVMEYLDGQNLKQMTDGFGGRIPPDVLLPLMKPIFSALEKVHERQLIHRDLSPDNLMMLDNGLVKILDFGNARATGSNQSMTMAMKEGFAPPEQYRTKGQGAWTDVYGICATIYYCLTGRKPTQALDRLMGVPFPTLTELGVELPEYQEKAIMQGMELLMENRIGTIGQLMELLYEEQETRSTREQVMEGNGEEITVATRAVVLGNIASEEVCAHDGEKEPVGFRQICIQIFHRLRERRDV